MKYSIPLLLVVLAGTVSCRNGQSNNTSAEDQMIEKSDTSYEKLKELLTGNKPIYGSYLNLNSKPAIEGPIQGHSIMQESKEYIVVRSTLGICKLIFEVDKYSPGYQPVESI